MSYIVIPIFSDTFLHPLHKDNDLSLLYLRHWGDREGRMICVNHPDCIDKESINDIKNDDSTNVAIKSFNLMDVETPAIWWGANYYANALPNKPHWIVWDKNNGGSDQMDCELAWTNLNGVTRQYTQASEKKNRFHPTQKPVELISWSLNKVEPKSVIDLFLGSGSTLIACEKAGRKCYGMEIDPHYCDVIVNRWEKFTGKEATRLEAAHA